MSKIRITFQRSFEVEESSALDRLELLDTTDNHEFSDDEIKESAIEIATDLALEDMTHLRFWNLRDYYSYTATMIDGREGK